MSVRDRVHEFDVLFQPNPLYHLQRPSLSPWRASPDAAASPTGSATLTTAVTQLPVKAAVTRYDGDMFRRHTPTQVNNFNSVVCASVILVSPKMTECTESDVTYVCSSIVLQAVCC